MDDINHLKRILFLKFSFQQFELIRPEIKASGNQGIAYGASQIRTRDDRHLSIGYLCAMADELLSNFDLESADDFLSDMSTTGYGLIRIAIDRFSDEEERPDLRECEEAVIACEIISAVSGRPAHDFPTDLSEWIEIFLPPGSEEREDVAMLAEKAADVIDRLVADSELRELWEESPSYNSWVETQVDLQQRILGD